MPLSSYARPRERRDTGCRAGRPMHRSKLPPLAQRGSWNVWAVNNYQSLSRALNMWNVINHAPTSLSPECDLPIVWHPGTQLMLSQHRQLAWRNLPKVSTLVGNQIRHFLFVRPDALPITPQGISIQGTRRDRNPLTGDREPVREPRLPDWVHCCLTGE